MLCDDCGFIARGIAARLVSRWQLALVCLFALLAASGKLTADRLYERASGTAAPAPPVHAVVPVHHPAAAAPAPYARLIERSASRHGLDPDLVRAVIAVESRYDPHARSARGALGLMQLMPATARALGIADPADPGQSIEGGSRYLRQLLDRFHGDVIAALAAYNAGPTALQSPESAPAETERFVENVLRRYAAYRSATALPAQG